MKGTLKLKTDNGKLSAELDGEPITLSQEAEEYLRNTYPANISETEFGKSLELSGKDLDCFYVDDVQLGIVKDERVKVLHLKPIVELDLDTGEYYIPENPIHAVTRRKPIVTPQINSKTKCPTCGSEVKIGGDGTIPLDLSNGCIESCEVF